MGCCWCKPDVLVPASGAPEKTLLVSRAQVGPYHVGDRVAAQYWSGGWYAATIEKENSDGTFTLSWDDGDLVDRVKVPDKLRRLEAFGLHRSEAPASTEGGDAAFRGVSLRSRRVTLCVERSRLLSSALGPVLAALPEELRPGMLRVEYRGEEGEDGEGGGGVTRAFLAQAGSLLGDARLGLVLPAPGGHLQLSPLPGFLTPRAAEVDSVPQQPTRWSRFFGRILGMCVVHECPLGLLLAPSLCKQLLGQEPTFEDLQFVPGLSDDGASWYRSLRALLAYRTPDLVQDDPTLTRLDAAAVDEALRGLEAAMPSRAEQVFQSLAAHAGSSSGAPQRWEEAVEIAARLLREANTKAQRDLVLDRTRELLEGIAAKCRSVAGSGAVVLRATVSKASTAGACGGPQDGELPQGLRRGLASLRAALRTLEGQDARDERPRRLLRLAPGDASEDEALELQQVACERRADDPPDVGPRSGKVSPACPKLERAVSDVEGPGLSRGEELTAANIRAFAEAVAKKALTHNLQPHLGYIIEEFHRIVPQRIQQGLTWQQVRDRISGRRLDPESFVREWRDRTTYQSCSEADESVRLWWGYVSGRTAEELSRLFAWCTGFAAIPVTAWKFQIKVVDDGLRCPTINTCMTDDPSAANRGVKMPTIYLPAYDSQATLAQKMEWAIAGASSMNLH